MSKHGLLDHLQIAYGFFSTSVIRASAKCMAKAVSSHITERAVFFSCISLKTVDISEQRCIEMIEEDEFPLGSVVYVHVEMWPWWPGLDVT